MAFPHRFHMSLQAKRGFLPSDVREFSAESVEKLRRAAAEVQFLLDRGYPVKSTTRFVGDHYLFSERQRLALARVVSPDAQIRARLAREVHDISGQTLCIDGFNVIIGMEIAFSDSMLFRGMDGTVRDLAGLHGTYRLIPQTDQAITALLNTLAAEHPAKVVIYLDQPVSNSGRLRQRIFELAGDLPFELEVLIENPVDAILKTMPLIASADAIILDECAAWFNLADAILRRHFPDYPLTDIRPR